MSISENMDQYFPKVNLEEMRNGPVGVGIEFAREVLKRAQARYKGKDVDSPTEIESSSVVEEQVETPDVEPEKPPEEKAPPTVPAPELVQRETGSPVWKTWTSPELNLENLHIPAEKSNIQMFFNSMKEQAGYYNVAKDKTYRFVDGERVEDPTAEYPTIIESDGERVPMNEWEWKKDQEAKLPPPLKQMGTGF